MRRYVSLATLMRVAVPAVLSSLIACNTSSGPGPSAPLGMTVSSLTVTSKSIPSDLQVPVEYTCDGKNVSPQLTWSAPPEGTKSLAIVVDDIDTSGDYTHFIAINLPPETLSLREGADLGEIGARIGQNDGKSVRYDGPCPPRGVIHRYRFRVLAVDQVLPLGEGATRAALDRALVGHLLGEGALVAVFSR
jgi:Raf kinase inhibitor-like YbhB/YbcL family protein